MGDDGFALANESKGETRFLFRQQVVILGRVVQSLLFGNPRLCFLLNVFVAFVDARQYMSSDWFQAQTYLGVQFLIVGAAAGVGFAMESSIRRMAKAEIDAK